MRLPLFVLMAFVLFGMVKGSQSPEIVITTLSQPLILNCSIDSNSIKWYKNDTELVPKDGSLKMEGSKLEIAKVKNNDLGSYSCKSGDKVAQSKVVAPPKVKEFQQSRNVPEGERLRLDCEVSAYPPPTLEWFKGGVILEESESDRIKFGSTEGLEKAYLIISEVLLEDRDEYTCTANNTYGSDNSTITIRIIDKYAALWPFLGICAEVIVLCTIIFIYEKRRNKAEFDESDTEQNDTKHVDNTKDSEVRHRK